MESPARTDVCHFKAKRLRDVCTCRKTNRSGKPDAASSFYLDLEETR